MQNCNAGKNQAVIFALAAVIGVPVYAGTGAHNPLLNINFGDYVPVTQTAPSIQTRVGRKPRSLID
jgi:hypothetical protein